MGLVEVYVKPAPFKGSLMGSARWPVRCVQELGAARRVLARDEAAESRPSVSFPCPAHPHLHRGQLGLERLEEGP